MHALLNISHSLFALCHYDNASEFCRLSSQLALGANSPALQQGRTATIQTLSGACETAVTAATYRRYSLYYYALRDACPMPLGSNSVDHVHNVYRSARSPCTRTATPLHTGGWSVYRIWHCPFATLVVCVCQYVTTRLSSGSDWPGSLAAGAAVTKHPLQYQWARGDQHAPSMRAARGPLVSRSLPTLQPKSWRNLQITHGRP